MVLAKADESATSFQPICDSYGNCCHFLKTLLTRTLTAYWQVTTAGCKTLCTVWPHFAYWHTHTERTVWKVTQPKTKCGALRMVKLRVILHCVGLAYGGLYCCSQWPYYYCFNEGNTKAVSKNLLFTNLYILGRLSQVSFYEQSTRDCSMSRSGSLGPCVPAVIACQALTHSIWRHPFEAFLFLKI